MRTAFNPMGVIDMAKDYIIDYGNNSNGWYRKWKSGFIEQGGLNLVNSYNNNIFILNFPISFTTTNYTFVNTAIWNNNPGTEYTTEYTKNIQAQATERTTSSITTIGNLSKSWYACGY